MLHDIIGRVIQWPIIEKGGQEIYTETVIGFTHEGKKVVTREVVTQQHDG